MPNPGVKTIPFGSGECCGIKAQNVVFSVQYRLGVYVYRVTEPMAVFACTFRDGAYDSSTYSDACYGRAAPVYSTFSQALHVIISALQ